MEPESWEEMEDQTKKLSDLNISAPSFVPNAFAQSFTPSFAPAQPAVVEPVASNGHIDKEAELVPDNILAPEEDEEEEMDEGEEDVIAPLVEIPKPKPKPKPPVEENRKDNINIVFIGHVDAGKSTISGHILLLTGQVDKRTMEKYEREAKEKNRESWYLSWALDTNEEERDKGKTVEVGRGYFETPNKRFTLLDAPGHRCFVSNMIGGAAQADVGILVISARKGEFETGFDRGGQTREHAMLAKTAGIKHLVVLINKMDDSSVEWSKERYNDCCSRLLPFLKSSGYNPKTDLKFMPASGFTGANLQEAVDPITCPWWSGEPLLTYLDKLPSFKRSNNGPFRMPIVDKYKDMGTIVMGKLESGKVAKNDTLMLMPNSTQVQVSDILIDDEEVDSADCGDNVKLKLRNVEEEDVSAGFVLCDNENVCAIADRFIAQIQIVELKNIIASGFTCIMHAHTAVQEVQFQDLVGLLDKKTGKKMPTRPRCVKQGDVVIAKMQLAGAICIEAFADFPQMGRFILRDEGKTIAIGKVLKVSEHISTQRTELN